MSPASHDEGGRTQERISGWPSPLCENTLAELNPIVPTISRIKFDLARSAERNRSKTRNATFDVPPLSSAILLSGTLYKAVWQAFTPLIVGL